MRLIKTLALALLAAACATEENHAFVATTPGTATVTTTKNLDYALLAVRRGETGPWTVDGFYCERGDAGALVIARDSGWRMMREPVSGLDAGIVTANVTTRLQSDPITRDVAIHIECDDTGLCSLSGQTGSVFAAHRAIEDTLAIPGVRVVESRLTF
jgi:hypothetical protein